VTKLDLITDALGELGIGAAFDVGADEQQAALRRLEAMLAQWDERGIRLGYSYGTTIGAESGLPALAYEAVVASLAVKLAPSYGKQPSALTLAAAKIGYDLLLRQAAQPPQQQLRSMPSGAGNKPEQWVSQPFLPVPTDPEFAATKGGDVVIVGD
jgi:hypothetical protein